MILEIVDHGDCKLNPSKVHYMQQKGFTLVEWNEKVVEYLTSCSD